MAGMKRAITDPIYQATLSSVLVAGVSFGLGWYLREPELVNRMGALLSGAGAALVVYQTYVEARMERLSFQERAARNSMPPADAEIAERIVAGREQGRKNTRFRIVAAIAVIVCVGELMHGWGDFVLRIFVVSHHGHRGER